LAQNEQELLKLGTTKRKLFGLSPEPISKEKFVLDSRKYNKADFTTQLLLGMESNGNTAEFIAKDKFDGLLFIKCSDIPN